MDVKNYESHAAKIVQTAEATLSDNFKNIDNVALLNQRKVLNAFINNRVSARHFAGTNGYGYDDVGRETLNCVFADVLDAESALVSPLIVSGTHALTLALFGILRPDDILLSVTGDVYDTLNDVISGNGNGSLKDFGIKFDKIELCDGKINLSEICKYLETTQPKLIYFQRSRGYSWRNALTIDDFGNAVNVIKKISPDSLIMVDNCYGEFTEECEPTVCGADIIAGSLIKNAGGGLAPTGGYIAGRKELVELAAKRLTTPSTGGEVGSYENGYRNFYQGIFLAPHTVAQALKGALLLSECMSISGFETLPDKHSKLGDIICSIKFNDKQKLIDFCKLVQSNSPIDGYVTPEPWDMPGYENQVIMAAGCFVQGASIELSCDAPVKPPYTAYLQGGLTYEHVKIVAQKAVEYFLKTNKKTD
ncbi:MAG: aminotransferase class I/II-fold pyridoxal phosphate-dependent enzyme [Christensenellales bacterium]|jgi:aluminum resistance protein